MWGRQHYTATQGDGYSPRSTIISDSFQDRRNQTCIDDEWELDP